MKQFILLPVVIVFSVLVNAQQSEKNEIDLTRDKGSIDVEFLGAELAGTFIAGKQSKFGYAVQVGLGMRFILNNPTYLYCGGGCDSGDCCGTQKLKAAYYGHMEYLKLKLFYRYYLQQNTYVNLGAFGSIGRLIGGDIGNQVFFTGMHFDVYTGWDKIKIGLKSQTGISFMNYKTNTKKTEYWMVTIFPALQFRF